MSGDRTIQDIQINHVVPVVPVVRLFRLMSPPLLLLPRFRVVPPGPSQ